jgi:hypothetical protein
MGAGCHYKLWLMFLILRELSYLFFVGCLLPACPARSRGAASYQLNILLLFSRGPVCYTSVSECSIKVFDCDGPTVQQVIDLVE